MAQNAVFIIKRMGTGLTLTSKRSSSFVSMENFMEEPFMNPLLEVYLSNNELKPCNEGTPKCEATHHKKATANNAIV